MTQPVDEWDALTMSVNRSHIPEFAFYYGDWIWREDLIDWAKSLLLFFDGIALALPRKMAEQYIDSDPILARPLSDRGLLQNFEPDLWLKPETANQDLMMALGDLMGAIEKGGPAAAVSLCEGHGKRARILRTYLERRSSLTERAASAPSGYAANMAALTGGITAEGLVQNITTVAIQPVINDEHAAEFVSHVLNSFKRPVQAKIITADIRNIGLNLSAVPLDEVLDFRKQYGAEFRSYVRDLRSFSLELSLMSTEDQGSEVRDRTSELNSRAIELFRHSERAFKRSATALMFGFAGAAWTLAHGDPWGAMLAAGTAAALFESPDVVPVGAAYSYILRAEAELTRGRRV